MSSNRRVLAAFFVLSTLQIPACGGTPIAPVRVALEDPHPVPLETPGQTAITEAELHARIDEVLASLISSRIEMDRLAISGHESQAEALLRNAIDPQDPIAQLALGNLLFARNPEASRDAHRLAFLELGRLPSVALEYGLDLHRAGQYRAAREAYRYVENAQPEGMVHALIAHCEMALGNTREALAAFSRSDHPHTHNHIEAVFADIYRKTFVWRDREVIALASSTEEERVRNLLHFDLDPPNTDLGPLRRPLEEHRIRLPQLEFSSEERADFEAAIAWATESDRGEASLARLRILHSMHPALRRVLFAGALDANAFEARAAYRALQNQMQNNLDDLRVRVVMIPTGEEHQAERTEVDRLGCEDLHSPRFCSSWFALNQRPEVAERVSRALGPHPLSATVLLISELHLHRASNEKLIAYLQLKPLFMPTSHGWKFVFLALEARLRGQELSNDQDQMIETILNQELLASWHY